MFGPHRAIAADGVGLDSPGVGLVEQDLSVRGGEVAHQRGEHRRLARTGRSGEQPRPTAADVQVQVGDHVGVGARPAEGEATGGKGAGSGQPAGNGGFRHRSVNGVQVGEVAGAVWLLLGHDAALQVAADHHADARDEHGDERRPSSTAGTPRRPSSCGAAATR
jgi:hypothetical protein